MENKNESVDTYLRKLKQQEETLEDNIIDLSLEVAKSVANDNMYEKELLLTKILIECGSLHTLRCCKNDYISQRSSRKVKEEELSEKVQKNLIGVLSNEKHLDNILKEHMIEQGRFMSKKSVSYDYGFTESEGQNAVSIDI